MRYIFAVCAVFSMLCGTLQAAVITLDPISGSVDAQPGQPAGWGFTILNDNPAEWISFTGSLLIDETNPAVGSYVDLIGAQGGPVDFSLQPQTTWAETFSDPDQTGLGEYLIAPNAPAGAQDSGAILVMWEQFAGDPVSCNCMPAAFSEEGAFQVTVDSAAPEPNTIWMAAIATAWLILLARIATRLPQRI